MPQITTDRNQALIALHEGKTVAIPTETVYGLAARIDKPEAIKAIFSLKNRPLNHPLIVHVAPTWDLTELIKEIPDYAHQLISKFWPGPLTLVLQCKEGKIDPLITGGQNTVAIRCPSHPLTQQLLQELKTPVVAPSANPFGKISPTTALHVKQSFADKDFIILDGGRCSIGIESTIVDASNPHQYQILRHGLLDEDTINKAVTTQSFCGDNPIRVPGKLDSHYQPQKPLYYFEEFEQLTIFCQKQKESTYVLACQKPSANNINHFHLIDSEPEQLAYELYYQLRKADESKAASIAIELPPNTSEWQGIRERILKAGRPYTS